MRKIFALVSSLLLATSQLAASYFGKVGEPIVLDGISWQQVILEHKDIYCSLLLPNSPDSGLSDGWFYASSEYRTDGVKVICEINTPWSAPIPPKTAHECWSAMATTLAPENNLHIVENMNAPGALYCLEWTLLETSGGSTLVRAYATPTRFYYVMLESSSLPETLRNTLFSSLSFTRS